jgi:outer membrane protein OmpA-like peptidoglycan-associated protein
MNRFMDGFAALVVGTLILTFGGCCFFPGAGQKLSSAPTQPETQALAPVVSPGMAVSLMPAIATLQQGQSQAFTAALTGSSNSGVEWSLNPALGSVSPTGVYTAPTSVALPENVTVTATSQADRSKTASGVVHLQPSAAAPSQVSIQMNVLFDSGKTTVKPAYRSELQKVADFMKSYSSANAEIEGHTDNTGSAETNQVLSQRRAEAVRAELIGQFGIAANRLTAKGYGQTKPVADNRTPAGRAQNRRVVATLTAAAQK